MLICCSAQLLVCLCVDQQNLFLTVYFTTSETLNLCRDVRSKFATRNCLITMFFFWTGSGNRNLKENKIVVSTRFQPSNAFYNQKGIISPPCGSGGGAATLCFFVPSARLSASCRRLSFFPSLPSSFSSRRVSVSASCLPPPAGRLPASSR